jgi:hypothetical protein
MLVLFAANDGIQVRLGASSVSPVQIVGSYGVTGDDDSAVFRRRPLGAQTNGTTPVEILSGSATDPLAIDWLCIKNSNAANAEVVIDYEVAGTLREFKRVVLAQHETLEYQDGVGWFVTTSAGAVKHSLNQGANVVASGDSVVVLAADVVNNNAVANTIASVTGLSFPVVSGQRYGFEFFIRYLAAATTTGSRFSVSGPTNDELVYYSEYSLTAGSKTANTGLTAFDLPATSNTSSATTGGNWAYIAGIVRPTANGDVIARFASEVANSAITVKAGSYLRYRPL